MEWLGLGHIWSVFPLGQPLGPKVWGSL